MSRLNIMLLVFALSPGSCLGAEEWIGLEDEQPVLIGIDLGQDELEDSSRALLLSLPLGERMGYYGYYSETELSDLDQEFDSLVLVTTLWFQLSQLVDIEIQYLFEGNEGELEKETLGLALALDQGEWNFRVQLEEGETLLFTRAIDSDFFDSFVPDSYATDVSGFEVSLGWQGDPWYWQLNHLRYDYEKDLSALSRSAFARFIVKSSTLAQSSLLVSQNASLLLGHADFENDYSLQISQAQSAIDESYDETLVFSWQHWASQRFAYLLAAATGLPLDDSVGLTLGLRWVL